MPKELVALLIVLGAILILFIIFTFMVGFIYFNRVFRRKKANFEGNFHMNATGDDHPDKLWLDSLNKEEITMKSYDKLNLKAYFVDNDGSTKLAILVHGYHGSYRSLAYQARMFYNHGFSLLLINNRCHDTSEGKYFTMGQRETRDLKDWINLMINRNDNFRITLFGVSMGGHIVMMSADKLPFNVMCAIEDCGFTSTYRQMLYTSQVTNAPMFKYSTFAASIVARLFFGFSCHNNAKHTLSKARIPFLFMHGNLDGLVPYANLDRAASYFPKNIHKEVVTFEDCDHCEQVHRQKDKYEARLFGFVDKFIK